MWSRIRYRLWQFGQELWPRPLPPSAWDEIAAVLTPAEMVLFRRYTVSDQTHCYRVMVMLRDSGESDPILLAAALLHDIGKTRVRLSIWDRVLVVVGPVLLASRVAAWGEGEPLGWRKAFVVKAQHAAWGAEMARIVHSHPDVVALIGRHQDNVPVQATAVEDDLLRRLQWADDQN